MRNFDYGPYSKRGQMAKDSLREMQEDASRLERALMPNDVLPAWVDYYINTSSDRLHVASRYMQDRIREFEPASYGDLQEVYGDGEPEKSVASDYLHFKSAPATQFIQNNWKPLAVYTLVGIGLGVGATWLVDLK